MVALRTPTNGLPSRCITDCLPQTADLEDGSELTLYAGGYGGIQPVEDGVANFCCVVQQRCFAKAGLRWESLIAKMQQDCPHLAMRLEGAKPLLDKPIAITHIPYGYIRRRTEVGLYCIGDQAAVIPSFTGDGISIALHTARRAAAAYLANEPGRSLPGKVAHRDAAPNAPCRGCRCWSEQYRGTCCAAVHLKSLALSDARNRQTYESHPTCCCSATGT